MENNFFYKWVYIYSFPYIKGEWATNWYHQKWQLFFTDVSLIDLYILQLYIYIIYKYMYI